MSPEELAALTSEWNDPWDEKHFMTPLERGLVDIYKSRPIRMKQFVKDFEWVKTELAKRGITNIQG